MSRVFHRIRSKLIVAMVVAVLIPLVGTGIYGNWMTSRILEEEAVNSVAYELRQRASRINAELDNLRYQVLTLSKLPGLVALLQAREQGDTADISYWQQQLTDDFLVMAKMFPSYYQVRYIAEDGQEWIRIDSDGNTLYTIATQQLQDKGNRYYFTETMHLPRGQVFVSPLDLNQEFGRLETPPVPVIRYATPVFFTDSRRAGIVIVNIFGQSFLRHVIEDVPPGHTLALVDENGYYLAHSSAMETWGGPGDLDTGYSLQKDYPAVWQDIMGDSSQEIVRVRDRPAGEPETVWQALLTWTKSLGIGSERIIVHTSVSPNDEDKNPRWVLFQEQPATSLFASLLSFRLTAGSILAAAVLGALLLAVFLAHNLTTPILALREGVHRLQRGERHQPVVVRSRDEIQELATAFNDMAVALQRRVEQLTLLNQAGNDIATPLEKGPVLEAIIQAMGKLFKAEYCVVSLTKNKMTASTVAIASGDQAWAIHRHDPTVLAVLQEALDKEMWQATELTAREDYSGYLCCAPLRLGPQQRGLLELYGRHLDLTEAATGGLLTALSVEASIAMEKSELYQQLAEHRTKLEALVKRLVTVQEEEHRVVTYDIHDGLVQVLVGARLRLANFTALRNEASADADLILKKVGEDLTAAIVEARRIIEGLRPPALDDLGLAPTLHQYAKSLAEEAGWQLDFQTTPPHLRASPSVEISVFRIAQEALSNARRYAAANRVQVTLIIEDGHMILEVRDDGRGFDPDAVNSDHRGLGLMSMRERAEILGGTYLIESAPNQGSRIRVEIPVAVVEGA